MIREIGQPIDPKHTKDSSNRPGGASLDTTPSNPGIPSASARPERTFPITTPERYVDVAVTQANAFRGAGMIGALAEATPALYAGRIDTSGSLEAVAPNLALLEEADATQKDFAGSAITLASFGGSMRSELAKASEHHTGAVNVVAHKKDMVARVDELASSHPALLGARANDAARAGLAKAEKALEELPESFKQPKVSDAETIVEKSGKKMQEPTEDTRVSEPEIYEEPDEDRPDIFSPYKIAPTVNRSRFVPEKPPTSEEELSRYLTISERRLVEAAIKHPNNPKAIAGYVWPTINNGKEVEGRRIMDRLRDLAQRTQDRIGEVGGYGVAFDVTSEGFGSIGIFDGQTGEQIHRPPYEDLNTLPDDTVFGK